MKRAVLHPMFMAAIVCGLCGCAGSPKKPMVAEESAGSPVAFFGVLDETRIAGEAGALGLAPRREEAGGGVVLKTFDLSAAVGREPTDDPEGKAMRERMRTLALTLEPYAVQGGEDPERGAFLDGHLFTVFNTPAIQQELDDILKRAANDSDAGIACTVHLARISAKALADQMARFDAYVFPPHADLPIPAKGNAAGLRNIFGLSQQGADGARALLSADDADALIAWMRKSRGAILEMPASTTRNGGVCEAEVVAQSPPYVRGIRADGEAAQGQIDVGASIRCRPLRIGDGKVWVRYEVDVRELRGWAEAAFDATLPGEDAALLRSTIQVPGVRRWGTVGAVRLSPGAALVQVLRAGEGNAADIMVLRIEAASPVNPVGPQ